MLKLIAEAEETLEMLMVLHDCHLGGAGPIVRAIVQKRIEATQAALDTARQAMSAGDADFRHSVSGDAEREREVELSGFSGQLKGETMKTNYEVCVEFYDRVCRRADENMRKTNVLEGAHFAAMKSVLEEMRFEEWRAVVIEFMRLDGWPHEAVSGENWDYWKARYYDEGTTPIEAIHEEVKVEGRTNLQITFGGGKKMRVKSW